MINSFRSMGTSQSAALADVTGRISEAMAPGILGLFVAVMAFWFYRYLSSDLGAFDCEMKSASADLVKRLISHVARLRVADPALGAALSRTPRDAVVAVGRCNDAPAKAPNFMLERTYRHGVLELIWLRLASELDCRVLLEAASCVCFAYGVVGFSAFWMYNRSVAASLIVAFFAIAGITIRKRWAGAVICVCAALFIAAFACMLSYGLTPVALCLLLAPVLLIGSWRTIRNAWQF